MNDKSEEIKNLRNEFESTFNAKLNELGLEIVGNWAIEIPAFIPVILKRIDYDKKRIFTIEWQLDEEDLDLGYAIRKTGYSFEERDLLIVLKDAKSNIELIIDCYRKWFVDLISVEDMDQFLESKME